MRKKGFTLVELLAVIVILAIILAIAIPGITGLVENARKSSFEDSVRLIIKSIQTKQATDDSYNVNNLSINNMEDNLGLSNENYQSIEASSNGDDVYVGVVGQNKWIGLEAYGTFSDLIVSGNDIPFVLAPDSCFIFDNGTGTINNYDLDNSSCPKNLRIPDMINGIYVEHIAPGAFIDYNGQRCYEEVTNNPHDVAIDYLHTEGDGYSSCYLLTDGSIGTITGVKLPNHLETIGYDAFRFNQLSSLVIPNSVTDIQANAFSHNQLSSLIILDSAVSLGYCSFFDNQLTNVVFGNNITELADNAFDSNRLTSLVIPSSITEIGEGTFANNQISNLVIPDSVATIRDVAFTINQLSSITIPSSVTSIGLYAFSENPLTNITIQGADPYRFNPGWINYGFPSELMPQ